MERILSETAVVLSPARKPRIAILEDNAGMRMYLQRILAGDFAPVFARDEIDLLDLVERGALELVLLDIGLPGKDGITVAQEIRMASQVPIVFVSGNTAAETIVRGLNIGGDDYLTKPFLPSVLLARVCSVLRRARLAPPPAGTPETVPVRIGESLLDTRRRVLRHPDRGAVTLTDMECRIVALLASRAGEVVSRKDLMLNVCGQEWDPRRRAIDVHVAHLRRKLREVGGPDPGIASVRGIGFRLESDGAR